jgi:hypothetical protein
MTFALHAQVRLPFRSGLPEDLAINNFNFWAAADPPDPVANIADVQSHLTAFYTTVKPFFSSCVNFEAATTRFYGGDDFSSQHTFLEEDDLLTTSPGSEVNLPNEVAVCLSFAGVAAIGGFPTNAQNRRGRVYLGPLNTSALNQTASNPPRVDPDLQTAWVTAGGTLLNDVSVDGVFEWVVVSRATGGEIIPITHGWCDNEFDTVRRRGLKPDAREVFAP